MNRMNKKSRDLLAKELLRRKVVLLKEVSDVEQGLQFISEDNSSELEECAQEQRTLWLLSRLDTRSRTAILEIDEALGRIADGTYGECDDCGAAIPVARLRILPATHYCVNCASVYEKRRRLADAGEATPTLKTPRDLSLLTDRDKEDTIREQVQEDGRIEMDDLRIASRGGVLHLEGMLPNESQHRILLQMVTNILGLEEIVDQVQVEDLLWEQESRSEKELQG